MASWQTFYEQLKKEGFEVYSPGQKRGECTSKYVVIKNYGKGLYSNISTYEQLYDIICYVPKNNYSELEDYVESVKKCLNGLKSKYMVRFKHQDDSSYFDEEIKGHQLSFRYALYKKCKEEKV